MNQLLRAKSSHRVLPKPGLGLKELRKWKQELIWDQPKRQQAWQDGLQSQDKVLWNYQW